MIRVLKHYVPYAVLFLGIVDLVLLVAAAEAGWNLRAWELGAAGDPAPARLPRIIGFGIALECAMVATGVYGGKALHSPRFAGARLLVALPLGMILSSALFFPFPESAPWRPYALYATGIAFAAVMAARLLFAGSSGTRAFKRRLLVLGAGQQAERIRTLVKAPDASFLIVGYVAMGDGPPKISAAIDRNALDDLAGHVRKLNADEVVLALDEQRNTPSAADLLRIKATGARISELACFLEQETGRIDLDSACSNGLIFSDGFPGRRRLSSIAKRLFDLAASLLLLIPTAPLVIVAAIAVKLESPGPIFSRQRCVGLYGRDLWIATLRSTRAEAAMPGATRTTGDESRITRIGHVLRMLRMDGLPRLWAVLKGEMSFVGPRPEHPRFVAALQKDLPYYAGRHSMKPGITGWAQINHPQGTSLEDARQTLEYDLYYARNHTPFLDILILLQTMRMAFRPEGAR